LNWLAKRILDLVDWAALREIVGDARDIPSAVEALILARDEEAADNAYWRIDNHVVVQGQLFESALPLTPILLALLAGELEEIVRPRVLELLMQIVLGKSAESELICGNHNLGDLCKLAVSKGLWLYYLELLKERPTTQKLALELIAECESDQNRLHSVLRECASFASDTEIRSFASALIKKVGTTTATASRE
jgi:hypothetical protein